MIRLLHTYKSGKKCDLDKFYTKENVVRYLLKYINFDKYDLIIEPSAVSWYSMPELIKTYEDEKKL